MISSITSNSLNQKFQGNSWEIYVLKTYRWYWNHRSLQEGKKNEIEDKEGTGCPVFIAWIWTYKEPFTRTPPHHQRRINVKNQNCLYKYKIIYSHNIHSSVQFSSVQSLNCVWLFVISWIAACQASLFITNSWSSLRLTSIESVMPSSHLILCHPLLLLPPSLPESESFPMSQLFAWGGQSTGVSALASFLPKKSQGWSPSEWTGCISLQSKGLSRIFSNTTVQKHQFFGTQPSSQSNSHMHTWPLEKP